MKPVVIREYRDADHDACITLCQELAEHHADIYEVPYKILKNQNQWLDSLMSKEGFVGIWLAEVDGRTVGFCGLFTYGEEGEIEPVVVTSSLRDKGIGSELIRHAVSEAKKKNVRYLSIHPVARNKEALSLFVRLGFNMVGHLDLFQDLSSQSDRTWKSGIEILGQKLRY